MEMYAMRSLVVLPACLLCGNLFADGKILLVDSYHEGYAWSDGISSSVQKTVGDKAELKIIHLDSKRRPSEEDKAAAARAAASLIGQWRPDVVIASDDNAVKYLLLPYLKDRRIPCVFCGVNWDASLYGLPFKNTTGMVEVSMVVNVVDQLKRFSKGPRLGFLGDDNETTRKEAFWTAKKLGYEIRSSFVKDMASWKDAYLKIQSSSDMMLVYNNANIPDWNEKEARDFITANTKIPTGSTLDFMKGFVLITFAKSAQEQGEWSAMAALEIINGRNPSEIPVAKNKRTVVYLNIPLAERMGVKFPIELIRTSKVLK